METVHLTKPFELPTLPYAYDALEPYIDEMTMMVHFDKHHGGYVRKLNDAVKELNMENPRIDELLNNISNYPDKVRNNAGGHFNHSFFWETLTPPKKHSDFPDGELEKAIDRDFGDIEKFRELFNSAALSLFGSGWVWLVLNESGELEVSTTPNQDNPLMDDVEISGEPLLGLDMWEHAYYLNYENRKKEFLEAFWNIVNWEKAEMRFTNAVYE